MFSHLTTSKKTVLAVAAAGVVYLIYHSRKRFSEHNSSPIPLDADLDKDTRDAVLASIMRETDPQMLLAFAGKLDAAGHPIAAQAVHTATKRSSSPQSPTHAGYVPYWAGVDTNKVVVGAAGDVVKAAQRALAQLGYAVESDGIVGKQTLSAIMKFQSLHDLNIDGALNVDTLAALGVRS